MDCVVIVPVLRRPHRAGPLVDSFVAATPADAGRLLFVCTEDDRDEIDAVKATGADFLILPGERRDGDFARKVNWAYRRTTEPLMLMAGDDVVFHDGWLEAAARLMVGPIGVVGTNDMANPKVMQGLTSTHPMIARRYVDEFGTIDEAGKVLHEGYSHQWCDTELVGTAKKRKAWAFARDSVVEHRHHLWGTAELDAVYELGRERFSEDQVLFRRRRRLWRL